MEPTPLKQLHRAAECLWRSYLSLGPGSTPICLLREFLESQTKAITFAAADKHDAALAEILEELEPLLRRCVERIEGLCFVTGEAGLIPRRDLHDRCEQLILRLCLLADEN